MASTWKTIAWQGCEFEMPGQWETARLERSYILLASQGEPVFEIRWDAIRGRFDPEPQLRRLQKALPARKRQDDFHSVPLPAAWQPLTRRFAVSAFRWQDRSISARGLLLYCKQCRQALALQFFSHSGIPEPNTAETARLLGSLRDHRDDGLVRWTVYDLSVALPKDFALLRFAFVPGHFQLAFSGGRRQMELQRWSNAGLLLKAKSLERFAVEKLHIADSHKVHATGNGSVLEWDDLEPVGRVKALLQQLCGRRRRQIARIWRQPERDRIFSTRLKAPPDPELGNWLRHVCGMIDGSVRPQESTRKTI